jgi:hypothetical protein
VVAAVLVLVDAALRLAWVATAAIAAAALVTLGYAGHLMILVWGAVAVPLAFVTAHRLRSSGRPLHPACRALALRSYALLTVATLLVHALLISGTSGSVVPGAGEALGMLAGAGALDPLRRSGRLRARRYAVVHQSARSRATIGRFLALRGLTCPCSSQARDA